MDRYFCLRDSNEKRTAVVQDAENRITTRLGTLSLLLGVGPILLPTPARFPLPERHAGSGVAQGGSGLAHLTAATIPDCGAPPTEKVPLLASPRGFTSRHSFEDPASTGFQGTRDELTVHPHAPALDADDCTTVVKKSCAHCEHSRP